MKNPLGAALIVGAAALLAGCGTTATQAATHPNVSKTITITDDAHHTLVLKKPATRVIAIEPSNAEIVLDLGLKKHLVGTDNSTLTYIPSPWKQQIHGVKSIGPSYPSINVEEVVAAKPDLVITGEGVTGISALAKFHIPVLTLEPTSIAGMNHDILLVGKATGESAKAHAVVDHLNRQFQRIEAAVKTVKTRPTVFYDLGGYTTGPDTFLNALIDQAGATNAMASVYRTQWPSWTAEQVVRANPDVILIDKGATTVAKEDHVAGFSSTVAVKTGHVLVVPQPSYTEEPSPALVMGLRELVHLLHPSLKVGQ